MTQALESSEVARLRALADKLIAEDDDHMVATGPDLDWLIAQIVAWPDRVDEDKTKNDRCLRFSAAATLKALLSSLSAANAVVEEARGVLEPFARLANETRAAAAGYPRGHPANEIEAWARAVPWEDLERAALFMEGC